MKKLIAFIILLSMSNFAFGQSGKLDADSVPLVDALLKPDVRDCIDSVLIANSVTNGSDGTFSVKEVATYTAEEPLFPGSDSPQMQNVTHYILNTRAYSQPKTGSSKMIKIAFDITIASGTGVLSYGCSGQVQ